ncbi:hypothetical protein TGVAND_356310 [Toxoplasma gondii VAND]|uniref:Uncharacterized protein n=1 Tax=Toxoplasma gondii VAND TaxID=933077 RepID=A0A086PI93_TOXGO|nr:hypothetical protein TGVAND_356310 [Toxoplasma gondii VAND]
MLLNSEANCGEKATPKFFLSDLGRHEPVTNVGERREELDEEHRPGERTGNSEEKRREDEDARRSATREKSNAEGDVQDG